MISLIFILFTIFSSFDTDSHVIHVVVKPVHYDIETTVYFALYCSQEDFSHDKICERRMLKAVDGEEISIRLEKPAGKYGIALFQDANNNGELDVNFIGIPNEPYAHSNLGVNAFTMPSWRKIAFDLEGDQDFKFVLK